MSERVEGFQISDYVQNTFKEKLYGKLPIGLIEHYEVAENEVEINLLVDICESLETKTISEKVKNQDIGQDIRIVIRT